jgi:hypothetical protein
MFNELTLSELKLLIKELRAHHNIRGYSSMKKDALVAELSARFNLRDGNLYLKEDPAPKPVQTKPKKVKLEPKPEKKPDMRPIPRDAV